jgi:hypothetical protein
VQFKQLITATSIALLPLTAGAATLIVPAAASTSGASGNVWRSELTLHSTSGSPMSVALILHDQSGSTDTATANIPARGTVALTDVVFTAFHRSDTIGAIEINVADSDANHLAVASRTFNVLANGELGQDIPAVPVADAAKAGEVAVISGPTSATDFRFNAGLYTLVATTIQWDLIRADGTIASSLTRDYPAGIQNQFSVPALFGVALQDNDAVHANITTGSAIFYGSLVNQASGDPAFVPSVRNREQSRITLLGVDRDQNGTIDLTAHDNVLDSPIESNTYGFPTFFRIVTDGNPVKFEIVSSTSDALMIDQNGQVELVPSGALKGVTGELRVRVTTADGQSAIVTIPVKFV